MTFPIQFRAGKRSLRWSGGGLLALMSLGLHGVLLGLPLPASDSAPPAPPDLADATAVMDVVRLPASQAPDAPLKAEVVPIAPETPVPSATVAQPQRPVAPTAQPPAATPAPIAVAPAPVDLEPLPPEPPPQTIDDRLLDPAAYAFNAQAKSLIANDIAFHTLVVSDWLETEGQGITDDNLLPIPGEKLPPLQVAYPLSTCLTPAPAEGVVGVIVSSTGQRLQDPVLLDSTGYTVFDQKAMEMVLNRAFPAQPAGNPLPNPRGYWLPIQVQYDAANCTS
ncbi:hypothetical protein [Nodosilinea sp. E11]|uniref:energy transducer TonB n=1 Tax=Nodosilinea sp. E11 TaxID=3037479 RepID=UPI00293526FF|nr:hypothetical protein [Nodosilinea sp. E11]WOD39469.1 hypothetical protein RRF56_25005 [Nodosilinea sp. E11]